MLFYTDRSLQVLKVQLGAESSWEEAELKLNSFAAVSHKLLEQVSALLVMLFCSSSASLMLAGIHALQRQHAVAQNLCTHCYSTSASETLIESCIACSERFSTTTLSQIRTSKLLTLFHMFLHVLQFQITGKLPQHKLLLDDSTTANTAVATGTTDISDDDDVEPLHESNCHNGHNGSNANAAVAQSPPLCRKQRQRARSAVAAAAVAAAAAVSSSSTSSSTIKQRTTMSRGSSSCSGRVTPASSPIKTRSSIAQALAHRKSTAAAAAAAALAAQGAISTADADAVTKHDSVLSGAHEAAAADCCSGSHGVVASSNVFSSTSNVSNSNSVNSSSDNGIAVCNVPSPVVAVRKAFLGA
jgi:hypothetical protein